MKVSLVERAQTFLVRNMIVAEFGEADDASVSM